MLQISEAYPEVVAMRSRDLVTGDWSTITYGQLQEQVTILYCTVLYCTVLNCTVLYCTVLQVTRVGRALIETGLHRHHSAVTVGLYNCPLAVIAHLAAISAG